MLNFSIWKVLVSIMLNAGSEDSPYKVSIAEIVSELQTFYSNPPGKMLSFKGYYKK